ncbi:MAG: phosphatase PAP2 family protein, partial [bacterium]|nr:phosphatase PAP2 family protein [bacterium]
MGAPRFREKAAAVVIFWIMAAATYFIIPKIIFFRPDMMPFVRLDYVIPFWSWTVLIYLTLYAQVSLIFLTVKDRVILNHLFWAYMISGLILAGFYFLIPTTHNYPPSVSHCSNSLDRAAVWLRHTDIAANQFPSGHALFSLLGPFFLLSAGRYKKGIPFLLWGILITISTLTVKQHNVVDVVAGAFFAIAFGYLFGMSCPRTDKL